MTRPLQLSFGFLLVAVGILVFAGGIGAGAVNGPGEWVLHARASNAGFAVGGELATAPGSGPGYEIVSFDAEPVTTSVATYVYGGPDLPAAHGGPGDPIVSCTATFTAGEMSLEVLGAYPYAGCVFFLGVLNTQEADIEVDLGALPVTADFSCSAPGCTADDLSIVAGGPDISTIEELCLFEGDVTNTPDTLTYVLTPGSRLACPVFVTVAQTAAQDSVYDISLVPSPTVVLPAAETPEAPGVGTGVIHRVGRENSRPWPLLLAVIFLAAGLFLAWPRRRSD